MTKRGYGRTFLMTGTITILPMIYGLMALNKLPATMITHWGVNNQPNGTMPRLMAVVGIPMLMLALQVLLWAVFTHLQHRNDRRERLAPALMWGLAGLTVILYGSTLAVNLGMNVNIQTVAMFVIGALWIIMGNYLPTTSNTKMHAWPYRSMAAREAAWRRNRRPLGYVMISGGIASLITAFLPWAVGVGVIVATILAVLLVGVRGIRA